MDFGPPHSIWCFAFEHYIDKKEIEKQLMKLFSMELPFDSDILT